MYGSEVNNSDHPIHGYNLTRRPMIALHNVDFITTMPKSVSHAHIFKEDIFKAVTGKNVNSSTPLLLPLVSLMTTITI